MKWMGISAFMIAGGFHVAGFVVNIEGNGPPNPWFGTFSGVYIFLGATICFLIHDINAIKNELAKLKKEKNEDGEGAKNSSENFGNENTFLDD